MVEPLVATKALPEPVTLALGVPEPHCAEIEVASASKAVRMENLAILVVVTGQRKRMGEVGEVKKESSH